MKQMNIGIIIVIIIVIMIVEFKREITKVI